MDEEDGRPGPVALKSGHLDALPGVPAFTLSLIPSQEFRSTPRTVLKFIGENQ